ncbi:MAG: phosphate transporter permease [Moraxellaceae bacterium]|jgi:phosphate transport system permease protein|nr:phosphate transporter permease [Moraxellaceae bacterium]
MQPNVETETAAKDTLARRARVRQIKDKLANLVIGFGGVFVIGAIALIFFYLLYEVKPLFDEAEFGQAHTYQAGAPAAWADMDEYNTTGMRLAANGEMQFFKVSDGSVTGRHRLAVPAGVSIVSVQRGAITSGLVGLGLSNGQVIVFSPSYGVAYGANNERAITPELRFPYGEAPLTLDDSGQPALHFALRGGDDSLKVLGLNSGRLVWAEFSEKKAAEAETEEGGMALGLSSAMDEDTGPRTYARSAETAIEYPAKPVHGMVIGQDARWGYVLSGAGDLAVINLRGDGGPTIYQQLSLVPGGSEVTALTALQGNISLLVGDSKGRISQWFLVRDLHSEIDKFTLQKIRSFQLGDAPVTTITPEAKRKGFVAGDAKGRIGYFFTTSERTIGIHQAADTPVRAIAVSGRSEGVYVQSEKGASFWRLHIEHPDISMKSTWGKVWYESYPEAGYTWQSTSGDNTFEGKLSLMPLTFGTLKAAFYAMLLAAPLAVCGAMYTAVFMAPGLRRKVKPAIELMQALPTVILGFLAGLWLAPSIEANLPGIFSLLLITPVVILLCGFAWSQLPREKRTLIPEGWAPVVLILPILLTGWLSFELSRPVEIAFFGGDVRYWLEHSTGLNFDQRNALIVGLTMGFAVIAPIFSIAEDALFAVPRHLTNGSLALGATQWQTLTRVVLPTASPGIFSALMIGFGRAVGETMIVLMATGNTAVMDWNIFEGMRTLSANVAVEMGEAEVGSTHFRVLFLSALVLFVLTFVLNTVAEIVRTRLRKKYGSL